ncbi:MAG TPA: T9SS type A sorting domain-containing protein, partial [Chitinispirillaceae bacterium]|nr:T9SS type A sorting domain-containing protein [Chitinispirillaceae bacterium]
LYDLETFSQKDTASFRVGMPAFVNNVISMNDSIAFILLSYNGSMRSSYFYLLPIMIRQNTIKVFSVMDLGSGRDLIFEFRGGSRNKIAYILRSKLLQLDYSQSIEQPLKFEYGYDGGLVYNQNFYIKDDLVCGYKGDSQNGMQFCFYNRFDASVSENSDLGSFRDTMNIKYIMKPVMVDSVKSRIMMAGENSIIIYGYESVPVGVKTPKTSLSALKNSSLKMQIFTVNGKIRIANSQFAPERIRILDLNGKLVTESYNKASAPTNGQFAEFNMRRLPAGVYLCSVEKLSEKIQAISKVQIP